MLSQQRNKTRIPEAGLYAFAQTAFKRGWMKICAISRWQGGLNANTLLKT